MGIIRDIVRETRDMSPTVDPTYRSWFAAHRASQAELERQRHSGATFDGPSFSIVVPLYDTPDAFFDEMLASVLAQSYGKWELVLVDGNDDPTKIATLLDDIDDERIRLVRLEGNRGIVGNTNAGIEAATGDYVGFLDQDDLLEPDALFRYAEAVRAHDGLDVLYCDEDAFSEPDAFFAPSFKPDFDRDLLYAHNYLTHLLVVRKALIDEIGLSPEDVSGAQDYDLTLRCVAAGAVPFHVPAVLYHWRLHEGSSNGSNTQAKPYAHDAGRLALQRHFEQRRIDAAVEDSAEPFVYRVRYTLPEPRPLVSIIIPNKDASALLRTCVDSIFERSSYDAFEVVIVENGSVEPETFALYERLEADHPNVRIVRWSEGFNYAALVNFGAQCARGEYLLFLNNDTRIITSDWIEEMLGFFARPEVGVVGSKLLYEDGTIQHAGIAIGQYDTVVHLNVYRPGDEAGYLGRSRRPQNLSAVTGACQMTRASLFTQLGGYDERFTVGFNDIDYCLRAAETGFLTVWTPFAELYHAESATRGRDEDDPVKRQRYESELSLFERRWPRFFEQGDPYLNPNLERASNYFTLPRPATTGMLDRLARVLVRKAKGRR